MASLRPTGASPFLFGKSEGLPLSTRFLFGKCEGLTHSADAVVTPHGGPGRASVAALVSKARGGHCQTPGAAVCPGACVPVANAGTPGQARGGPGSAGVGRRQVAGPGGPGSTLFKCVPALTHQPLLSTVETGANPGRPHGARGQPGGQPPLQRIVTMWQGWPWLTTASGSNGNDPNGVVGASQPARGLPTTHLDK